MVTFLLFDFSLFHTHLFETMNSETRSWYIISSTTTYRFCIIWFSFVIMCLLLALRMKCKRDKLAHDLRQFTYLGYGFFSIQIAERISTWIQKQVRVLSQSRSQRFSNLLVEDQLKKAVYSWIETNFIVCFLTRWRMTNINLTRFLLLSLSVCLSLSFICFIFAFIIMCKVTPPYNKLILQKIRDAISSRMKQNREKEYKRLARQWYAEDVENGRECGDDPKPLEENQSSEESEWELL